MKKFLLGLVVLTTFFALYFWRSRDVLMQVKYDLSHSNAYVDSQDAILEIISKFKAIPFADMDVKYVKATNQDVDPFKQMLQGSTYLKIPQSAVYQKIVGDFRIKEFLPKDDFYKHSLYAKNDSLYWLVDKKILFQVLAFQNLLSEQGYDRDAFVITNGFRHPKFNKEVGGASQSRHIMGEAVDITARDINGDGKINEEDKTIIAKTAEMVVGNSGGVGLYPGTLSIHIDTRGYKARWDSF